MIDLPDLPLPLPGRALPRLPEPRTAPEARTPPWRTGPATAGGARQVGYHIAAAVSEAQADAEERDEAFGSREVLRAVAHGVARADPVGPVRLVADELHRVADEMAGPG